jgi:dihydroxyacetone kinase-like protein
MIDEMLDGFIAAYPEVVQGVGKRIVLRRHPKSRGLVALAIGNGSGHEPANLGFVGYGMLDVNICGDFFSAPSGRALAEGIRAADRGAGVVLFVANHSGDVLNVEIAKSEMKDDPIEFIPVLLSDDISTAPRGQESMRRGRGGAIFAFKIAGALAEQRGASLLEVALLAEHVAHNTRSLGASTKPYSSFETGRPVYQLPEGVVEIGTGAHGEGGGEQLTFCGADHLSDLIINRLIDECPDNAGREVLVLVNGTGSTSLMELYIAHRTIDRVLSERDLKAMSTIVGNYVTTQDMAGLSVSLCWVDEQMKEYWSLPCSTPHFSKP